MKNGLRSLILPSNKAELSCLSCVLCASVYNHISAVARFLSEGNTQYI